MNNLIITIDRSKKFDFSNFTGAKSDWTIWLGPVSGNGLEGEEEQDARSLALTEIDMSKVVFENALREGETEMTGEEKLLRLRASGNILLDAGVGEALWLDYKKNGENSVLENLRKEKDVMFMDFFGSVLRRPDGERRPLFLMHFDGQWYTGFHGLYQYWRALRVTAVLH